MRKEETQPEHKQGRGLRSSLEIFVGWLRTFYIIIAFSILKIFEKQEIHFKPTIGQINPMHAFFN